MRRRGALALLAPLLAPVLAQRTVELGVPDAHAALGLARGARYLVVPVHEYGLANRLRVLASAAILAADEARALVVDWRATGACNATLGDLFDGARVFGGAFPPELSGARAYAGDPRATARLAALVNKSHPLAIGLASPAAPGAGAVAAPGAAPVLLVRNPSVVLSAELVARARLHDIVLLRGNGFFVSEELSCQEYFWRKQRVYAALAERVVAPLRAQLLDARRLLAAPVDGGGGGGARGNRVGLLVGVHVRAYDPAHDWAVVPPQPSNRSAAGAAEAGTWDEVAPLEAFAAAIGAMRAHGAAGARARFFVASNDARAKRALIAAFPEPGALVTLADEDDDARAGGGGGEADAPPLASRDTPDGVRRALLEFLLLSGAVLILHSYGSSFGEEAAAVHGVPSVRVRKGGHIYGTDLSMAQCNQPQLINAARLREAAAAQNESAISMKCYRDPSRPDEVCTPRITKSLCGGMIEAWGVPNVYC